LRSTRARTDENSGAAPAKVIRVMIADDHWTVLTGLSHLIGMQPDMAVVAEAANGREAVELWRKHSPDVTLLDLRMPQMDGAEVLDEIRRQNASARVIVLTTYDSDADIYQAVRAGAKGYLLKDVERGELLDCIRKVNSGETCLPQGLVQKLARAVSSDALTSRELEVLTLLAAGKANKEIAEALYVSVYTVKGHLRRVFKKLCVVTRTEAVVAAKHRGLVRF
jgi:DNA-binding NarL/FixJ family response regulator